MGGVVMGVVVAVVVAGGGDQGGGWYPPPSDSPCWREYTTCQLAVYDAHQRGMVSDSEMIGMLEDCKRELGWCALVRWLRDVMGMSEREAGAFVGMVGADVVWEIVELKAK